jgi:hypothetical protein
MFNLLKRAAADPRVQRKAGQAFRKVDNVMDQAADKAVRVASADDPAKEVGKAFGRFLSGNGGAQK